jgi:hypothetical protein
MPKVWDQSFFSVRYNRAHVGGLFALVEQRSGLDTIQDRPVSKAIATLDVLMAAMELRAPLQPWADADEIVSLVADLSLNVPELELHDTRAPGSSLPALRRLLSASSLSTSVLGRLQRVFAASDALARGTLRNINLTAPGGEISALHHAALSIPPCHDYAGGSLYKPARLVTLIFDVGILFPLPPAMGLLGRLVR